MKLALACCLLAGVRAAPLHAAVDAPVDATVGAPGYATAGAPVYAATDAPVYAANYDLVLEAEGNHRATMRVRVRDGHAIPVEFQGYKVEIAVAGKDDESVAVELRLFEKTDHGDWFPIPAKGLAFPAQLGIPVQFSWAGAGLELDLALVLSVAQP